MARVVGQRDQLARSVGIAVTTAVMLEQACRVQLLADGFGGVAAPLPAPESERAYAHTLDGSYVLSAWRYLVRRTLAEREQGGSVR